MAGEQGLAEASNGSPGTAEAALHPPPPDPWQRLAFQRPEQREQDYHDEPQAAPADAVRAELQRARERVRDLERRLAEQKGPEHHS
eukprot:4106015-Lingulodinium_polyedra.AAC.1